MNAKNQKLSLSTLKVTSFVMNEPKGIKELKGGALVPTANSGYWFC